MPDRARIDEYVLEVEREPAFNDDTDMFDGDPDDPYRLSMLSFDRASIADAYVEDESMRITGGGREKIQIPAHGSLRPTFGCYIHGQGVPCGDGITATENGHVLLAMAAMQCEPDYTTGSTVAADPAPAVGAITESDVGAHAVALDGGIGIAAVALPTGRIEPRAYTYDDGELTPLMNFSEVPAAGAIIYGGAQLEHIHTFAGAPPVSLGLRFVGNDRRQNRRVHGAVLKRAMPNVRGNQVPRIDYSVFGASFVARESMTRVCAPKSRAKALAPCEFLIAKFGNAVFLRPQLLGVSWDDGREWYADTDDHDSDHCVGWQRPHTALPHIKCTVPHNQAVPNGISVDDWHEILRNDAGTNNDFHIQFSACLTPGKGFTRYYPRWILDTVEDTEVEGDDALTLTFVPLDCTHLPDFVELNW